MEIDGSILTAHAMDDIHPDPSMHHDLQSNQLTIGGHSKHSAIPSRARKPSGRPRIHISDASPEDRRREQMRKAQDTYRGRKQKEIAHIKKQNSRMRGVATKLGASLVALLEQVVDGNSLKDNLTLTEQVASSVRNMLQLVDAMKEETVDAVDNITPAVGPSDKARGAIQGTTSLTTLQDVAESFGATGPTEKQHSIPEGATNLQTVTSTSGFDVNEYTDNTYWVPVSPNKNSLRVSQYSTNAPHQSSQNIPPTLYDWFSAKSLVLDPALDLYATGFHFQNSLAERINHAALLRASRMLQLPTTTMDLVHKIFPFDKDPAPPHIELAKINELLARSRLIFNMAQGDAVPSPRIITKYATSSTNFHCVHGNIGCATCKSNVFPLWLSAYDIERYLGDRWNVSPDLVMRFIDNSMAENGMRILRLKMLDLIDGFIENGICSGNGPVFERADVDRVVKSIIEKSQLASN